MAFPKRNGRQAKYGAAHVAERKRRLKLYRPGDPCGRCGKPLPTDTSLWHLPHNDAGTAYLPGFWCRPCNVNEAASRGAKLANARRKSVRRWAL